MKSPDNSHAQPVRSTRLLRGFITLTILVTWTEIAFLHFRGSFHNHFMYAPFFAFPAAVLLGVISTLKSGERRSAASFRIPALIFMLEGCVGTLLHIRGLTKEMGGLRNWKYNVQTGPPFPAPAQVALVGTAGVAAASGIRPPKLARVVDLTNALGYLLIATEAAWNHYRGYFYNKLMFVPAVVGPTLALVHIGSLFGLGKARKARAPLSALAAIAGLIGFTMHIRHIAKWRGGFRDPWDQPRWDRLFFGPPLFVPLQFLVYGVLALLTARPESR
jgi:hypothetical protein